MARAGKSAVGKKLARALGYNFIEIDALIEKRHHKRLQTIVDELGEKGFMRLEEKAILTLGKMQNTVISPGESIIYSPRAMKHLRKISKVIHLAVSFETIKKRVNPHTRGLIGLQNKTLKNLYTERLPLYKKYAHHIIDARKFSPKTLARKILGFLGLKIA